MSSSIFILVSCPWNDASFADVPEKIFGQTQSQSCRAAVDRERADAPVVISAMTMDPRFFERDVEQVARDLIGVTLCHAGTGGVVVETEAYDAHDPASHSFRGPSPRNAVMFGPPGHLYIYRIYGLHWCLNVTCGQGSAVLIRALEPTTGIDVMMARRGVSSPRHLCSGPGRLCQALGIDGTLNGHEIGMFPVDLRRSRAAAVIAGPRIGISVATEKCWRFCEAGSPYLSRPAAL